MFIYWCWKCDVCRSDKDEEKVQCPKCGAVADRSRVREMMLVRLGEAMRRENAAKATK